MSIVGFIVHSIFSEWIHFYIWSNLIKLHHHSTCLTVHDTEENGLQAWLSPCALSVEDCQKIPWKFLQKLHSKMPCLFCWNSSKRNFTENSYTSFLTKSSPRTLYNCFIIEPIICQNRENKIRENKSREVKKYQKWLRIQCKVSLTCPQRNQTSNSVCRVPQREVICSILVPLPPYISCPAVRVSSYHMHSHTSIPKSSHKTSSGNSTHCIQSINHSIQSIPSNQSMNQSIVKLVINQQINQQ